VRYGAKAIPTGGLYAQPKLYVDGALLVGDSAGMCDAFKLSGVHMAMKTGMMAADTLLESLREKDSSSVVLGRYAERYRASWAYQQHREARNFHGSMEVSPIFAMGVNIPLMMVTGGRGIMDPIPVEKPGHAHMQRLSEIEGGEEKQRAYEKYQGDGKVTFSKEHLVQFSGTQHEVDQPSHLVVSDTDLCRDVCSEEFGNPCEKFCPAAVYEMVPDPEHPGKKKLFIHHENCVHCKTCDIADPYQVITWTPPEGGEGPDYTRM
jgi:electron-transferring-flavoprotein dehydrogenase